MSIEEQKELSFDEAFDEATSEGDKRLEDRLDAPQEDLETEPVENDAATQEVEEDDTTEDVVQDTEETEEDAEDVSEESTEETSDEVPEVEQLKALYELERSRRETAEQRYRTSEGRFRAFRESEQDKAAPSKDGKEETAVDSKALQEFQEEFPEFVDPINDLISARVNEALGKVTTTIDERINPITEKLSTTESHSHFDAIGAAHPDWELIVNGGDLDKWQASLAPMARSGVEFVRNNGTAQEVIEMLDNYKQDRGLTKPQAATQQVQQAPAPNIDAIVKQVKAAMAVPSSRSSSPRQPKVIDRDDFDAAFDDATKND